MIENDPEMQNHITSSASGFVVDQYVLSQVWLNIQAIGPMSHYVSSPIFERLMGDVVHDRCYE